MRRNIYITYALSFLRYAWFWLGIWVMYYLRFTNYTGIGILETVMIVSSFVLEIPTGAIGDLLGKKKTLFLAFLFFGLGNVVMGFSQNFLHLSAGIVIAVLGGAMTSGTLEALTFDTLVEEKKTDTFEKVTANQKSFQLLAMTVASITGGFLYQISPGLPFLMVGLAGFIGCVFALLLIEPKVDTDKFSLKNYLTQNKQGFAELFKSSQVSNLTLLLLFSTVIYVVLVEGLEDMILVEFAYSSEQLGIISGFLCLVLAIVAQLAEKISKKFKPLTTVLALGLISSFTLLLNPIIFWWLAPFFTTFRSSSTVITEVITSNLLNNHIQSKYRATALSSFEMLKKIPYVVLALPVGYIADVYSARILALILGVVFFVLIMLSRFAIYPKLSQNS